MLFVAHMIATSVNAGRVAITRNPLAINDPEWVMFAKLGFRQTAARRPSQGAAPRRRY
jgi:hypothetical protein